MTKSVEKKENPPMGAVDPVRAPHADMQAAYQIHTLAQMLYGQMAAHRPWTGPTYPAFGYDPAQGYDPGGGYDPMRAMHAAHQVPVVWPMFWTPPFGWGP